MLIESYEINQRFQDAMTDLGVRDQDIQLYTLEDFVNVMRYIIE